MFQILPINPQQDVEEVTNVITSAFSETPDSDISDWFSVTEMVNTVIEKRGACLKEAENNQIVGVIHAQAENPINGREDTEKWVITNLAVLPSHRKQGVGSALIENIEKVVTENGGIKLFVHTNLEDEKIIQFYQKNGFAKVGQIKDYYYAGSAIFLLKNLKR